MLENALLREPLKIEHVKRGRTHSQLGNVIDLPQPKVFVSITPHRVRLVDQFDRRRQSERRTVQIQRTPLAGDDVAVVIPIDERRRQQITAAGPLDVVERKDDVAIREVHKTIAA